MSKHVDPAAEVSPKVKAVGLAGGGLFVAVTIVSVILSSVTPEHLGVLGVWAGPVAAGLVAGGAALAGYLKGDWLRSVGAAAATAGEVPPADLPHPDAVPGEGESVAEATVEADALAARAAELRGGGVK